MGVAYKIVPEGDGFYTVKDVPIFECHDTRGFDCNEEWMREAVQNFLQDKSSGYRPTIIIGHNVKGVEKESVGFLDNFILKGKRLYADLVRIPRDIKEKIVKNAYPGRSVEVLAQSKRILALALLGGTTPFFSLPQMAYSNDEESTWLRSPLMGANGSNGNGNGTADINTIVHNAVSAALKQYSQQDAEEEAGPEVYNLTIPQAAQFLQNNPDVEVFQAEDGNHYAAGDQGEYYQIPGQLLYSEGDAAPSRMARAKAAVGNTAHRAKEAVGNAASTMRSKAKRGFAKTKGRTATTARAVGGHARTAGNWARNNKLKAAGIGAGIAAAGVGGYLASRDRDKYQIDSETGVVYFNGEAIGEVSVYSDTAAPSPLPPTQQTDPDLVIEEGSVGPDSYDDASLENDPGDPTSPQLVPLRREDSDQFSQVAQATNYALEENEVQNTELYQLKQQVEQLTYANQLLNVSRQAENYKSYLLNLKKSGTPIGDVDQTLNFMMSQSPEQVAQFKAMLEKQPKLALGPTTDYSQVQTNDDKVAREFNNNRKTYSALGVGEQDLKYAQYVRVNRFANETGDGASFESGDE